MRDLARRHIWDAIRTLVTVMRAGKPDPARAAAAEAILDRGWGRPAQALEHSGALELGTPPIAEQAREVLQDLETRGLLAALARRLADRELPQQADGNGTGEA